MKTRLALLASSFVVRAFDNRAGWKLDADGKIEMKDGNPIYLDTSGREMAVEHGTISRLNGEARTNRERAEAAEASLKAFEGLDPEKARSAVETIGKIDQKTLIDAGEIDKVREEVGKGYTAQIAERDGQLSKLSGELSAMRIGTGFATSKFASENIAVPLDMFQDKFQKHFKDEGGTIVPYDASGSKVYSKKRLGEVADFDEALEILVEQYPHKDRILKAPEHSGSGNGGGGGSRGGGRVVRRADFEKLSPTQQAETAGLAGKGELTIVD